MLRIVLVDESAEARRWLEHAFSEHLERLEERSRLLPRVTVRTAEPIELRLLEVPSLIVVGPFMTGSNAPAIANIRRAFPDVPLIAWLPAARTDTLIDHLARIGCEDYFTSDMPPSRLFERLVLVARRGRKRKPGRLILVDSAKGGAGVTTITAALGEYLLEEDKRVALVDLDFESQFLCRFLESRPFISENFSAILTSNSTINEEMVADCAVSLFDDPNFCCVAPPPDRPELYDARPSLVQSFISFIEVLDSMFDVVIVDRGKARGPLLKALYQHADSVVYVAGNDPCSVIGAALRLSTLSALLPPEGRIVAIQNNIPLRGEGLPISHLKEQMMRIVNADRLIWSAEIPWSTRGARWAGSRSTFLSADTGSFSAFQQLADDLGLIETPHKAIVSPRQRLSSVVRRLTGKAAAKRQDAQAPIIVEPKTALLPATDFISHISFSTPSTPSPSVDTEDKHSISTEGVMSEEDWKTFVSPLTFQ